MIASDYFDKAELARIRSFNRSLENAEKMALAAQTALSQHQVVQFVKSLSVESTSYPAKEYHMVRENLRGYSLTKKGQEILDLFRKAYQEGREPTDEEFESIDVDPSDYPYRYYEHIDWSMPAHDLGRPKRTGCGFIAAKGGRGMVYTACPSDYEHHCKGKRLHCWSLHCPNCMNDTALKRGIEVEKQLLTYQTLLRKQGRDAGKIGHWVVSPPQDVAKILFQARDDYDRLTEHIENEMKLCGIAAGVLVVHPWRQKETMWEFSPHFHSLAYGRVNTKRFLARNPGWIIKKVHAREEIRSIRHTAAYLFTHMGLGTSEVNPDDIDWDARLMNIMIPDNYNDDDMTDRVLGRGRMVGDFSRIDWDSFTMTPLSKEIRLKYYGDVRRGNIVNIGSERQYKIRVCKQCGNILRTYDGTDDCIGCDVKYIQDNRVYAFRQSKSMIDDFLRRNRAQLRESGMDLIGFAANIPQAVSTLELPIPANNDIVMDGPFEHPDSYYLKRQKAAYGKSEAEQ